MGAVKRYLHDIVEDIDSYSDEDLEKMLRKIGDHTPKHLIRSQLLELFGMDK